MVTDELSQNRKALGFDTVTFTDEAPWRTTQIRATSVATDSIMLYFLFSTWKRTSFEMTLLLMVSSTRSVSPALLMDVRMCMVMLISWSFPSS